MVLSKTTLNEIRLQTQSQVAEEDAEATEATVIMVAVVHHLRATGSIGMIPISMLQNQQRANPQRTTQANPRLMKRTEKGYAHTSKKQDSNS